MNQIPFFSSVIGVTGSLAVISIAHAQLEPEMARAFLETALSDNTPTRAFAFATDLGNPDAKRKSIDELVEAFYPIREGDTDEQKAGALKNRKLNADRLWKERAEGRIQAEAYSSLGRSFRVGVKSFAPGEKISENAPVDRVILMLFKGDSSVGEPIMVDYLTKRIVHFRLSQQFSVPTWVAESGRSPVELRAFLKTMLARELKLDESQVAGPTPEMVALVSLGDKATNPQWTFASERNADGTIQISISQPNLVLPIAEITCSGPDCKTITSFVLREPRKGTTLASRQVSKVDSEGLPILFQMTHYNMEGNLISNLQYEIVSRSYDQLRGNANDLFPSGTADFETVEMK